MSGARELLLDVPSRVRSSHTALVVIDMQNDFCAPGGWTDRVIKKDVSSCEPAARAIGGLVEIARAAKVSVAWVRADYSLDNVVEPMAARSARMGLDAACCVPGTWGADWFGVKPVGDEAVFTKHCYSGFMGTSLDAVLQTRGIRTIVFAGVQTHVCVESTLRDAHSLGYYCVVPPECVASHTPAAHEVTLANVRFLFGDVVPLKEIEGCWRR
jgi:ureidoacrylate peracid hydrolase